MNDAEPGTKGPSRKVTEELDAIAEQLVNDQKEAGTVLMAHLSKRPHAVLIISVSGPGNYLSHCMGFRDPGAVLIAKELAHNISSEQAARFFMAGREVGNAAAAESNPPAPAPECPT